MCWQISIMCAMACGANARCDHLRGVMAFRGRTKPDVWRYNKRFLETAHCQSIQSTTLTELKGHQMSPSYLFTVQGAFWNVLTKLYTALWCRVSIGYPLLNHNALWFCPLKSSCSWHAWLKKHRNWTTQPQLHWQFSLISSPLDNKYILPPPERIVCCSEGSTQPRYGWLYTLKRCMNE